VVTVGFVNSPTSTFTGIAGNSYTLSWTISNSPCSSSSSTTNVTFNVAPTTSVAGPNQTGAATCGLTQVTLAANTPTIGTGAWSILSGAGGSLGNVNSPTSTFSGTPGVAYTLSWVITNGICTSSSNVNVTFNINPTTSNAGNDQTGASTCGLTTVSMAATPATVGTGAWSIISGIGGSFGTPSSATSTFSGTAGNTYNLKWTTTNGVCTSIDSANVTFNKAPTTSNAGTNQTSAATCGLTTVTLAANTPTSGTGTWSITSGTGGSFGNVNSPTSTFSGIPGNTYILTWTISTLCSSSSSNVTVTFNLAPTQAVVGSDQTGASTCGLTQVNLSANALTVGSGLWTILTGSGGILGTPSSPTSTFTGTAGTAYSIKWTTTNGVCSTMDTMNVTFNKNPTPANAGTDQTGSATCGLTTVTLAATPVTVGSGLWSILSGSGSGGSLTTTTKYNTTFSGTAGNTYKLQWAATNGVCVSLDTTIITFNQNPTTANAGSNQTGSSTCGLTTVTLAGNTPTVGTGTWSIISGTGGSFGNVNSPTSTFSGVAGNTYTLSWTISNSPCTSSSSSVTVTFNTLPSVSISPNYCMGGGGVQLTSSAATSYLWSTGSTKQMDTVDIAGTYSVTVTNAIGCTNTASYLVAQELVVNGNFAAGNTGFTSGYTYTNQQYTTSTPPTGLWPEGLYAIDTNAHNYHPVFYGTAHTNPGTGKFMIVNGYPNTPNIKVWQETVTIQPNTTYYFSAWALSMDNVSPFAQLQFEVNDSTIGTTAVLAGNAQTSGPYNWVRFYGTWTSGNSTTAVISIVDLQTAAGGNDFGVADISCSTLSPVTFSVTPSGTPACVGGNINLSANLTGGTSPFTYAWTGPATDTYTSTLVNPTVTNVAKKDSGTYTLKLVDGFGCTTTATTSVPVYAYPVNKTVTAVATSLCSGSSTNIQVALSQVGVTYQLQINSNDSAIGTAVAGTGGTINLPTGNLTSTTTFNVSATTTGSTCSYILTTTPTIIVNPIPTLTGATAVGTCSGSSAQINLSGLVANTTSTITYKINGGTTQTATNVVSNAAGAASFNTPALTTANNGQTLQITGITITSSSTNCAQIFTQNVTLIVGNTTLGGATNAASVCSGSTAQINLTGLVANSISTITYTINGGSTQTVTGVIANSTGAASFNTIALTATNNGNPLLVTGVTNTSATPGCPITTSKSATLSVNAALTLGAATISKICSGSSAQVNLTGLVAGSTNTINYTINGVTQTPVSGVVTNGSGAASFNTTALSTTNNGQTLQITSVSNGTCSQTFAVTATLAVTASGTWLGVDSNWQNTNNWCGGIPTLTTNVLIPNGLSKYPIIATGVAMCDSITIQSAASVTVTGGKLQVAGAISSSNVLNATAGTIELIGSTPQSIGGSMFVSKTINDFIISNTNASGVTVSGATADSIKITDALSFGNVSNAVLNTGNNIVIRSTINKTARVADVTNGGINSGNTISGYVTVERYLQMQNSSVSRRWRLLTAPIQATGAPSINASWQEGVSNSSVGSPINPKPGYGTEITINNSETSVANGFDIGTTNNPSIYAMSPGATPSWSIPSSTLTTPITNFAAFMIFARGDRSIVISNQYIAADPTTLEVKGNLNVGNVTKTLVTGTQPVGNPYASAINFDNVTLNGSTPNTSGAYYNIWDPKTSGSYSVGKFITVMNMGTGNSNYIVTPLNNVSGIVDGTIQSGDAIVLVSSSPSNSITFHETDKISTSSNISIASRPSNTSNASDFYKLSVDLFSVNPDSSESVADGVAVAYFPTYSNDVDQSDAVKSNSFNSKENLSISRDNQLLAIEKRQSINVNDTIFLAMRSMSNMAYKFEFDPKNFKSGLDAFLIDQYLGTSSPISIVDTTKTFYNFKVSSSIPASAAQNRFMIVFRLSSTLPVTFDGISATLHDKDVLVKWNVQNEVNIKDYVVEKSTDGINFTPIATVNATGNNSSSVDYNSIDQNPSNGTNLYRIESVDNNGTLAYSQIATVDLKDVVPSSINVYPTIISNGEITLQMTNMPQGKYAVRLLNPIGQVIYNQDVNHLGGNATFNLSFNRTLAKGAYQIEVFKPDYSKASFTIISQ